LLQVEEDSNLAPQMSEGGFQFNPAAAGSGDGSGGAAGGGGTGDSAKPFEF
jgi:hypothetical protein